MVRSPPLRMAMTLDVKSEGLAEYMKYHEAVWPEVQSALTESGVTNLSLWVYGTRMFYYCEYIGDEPFEDAMKRYAKRPRVAEWEELMHNYQVKLPGADRDDVWWQPMQMIVHQD